MSGGQNTTTTQSGPPQQYLNAYSAINDRATSVANTPYSPYQGNLVAGLSPDQQSAIGSIQNLQGVANPYIDAAAQEIGQSTNPLAPTIQPYVDQAQSLYSGALNRSNPSIDTANSLYQQSAKTLTPQQFSAGAISQYESPYTKSVVDATQAQFNNQNAIQQAGVSGNAISQGAFGGDREAVAHGITAGQEQLAQAPVIAGLQNQGYAQALNEFNQQQGVNLGAQQASQQLKQGAGQGILAGNAQNLQGYLGAAQGISGLGGQVLGANEANSWLASQAGYGLGNLGNEALQTGLTGANAQLGAGGLEQQQAQQSLNVPYAQYQAAQAYPFQTTGWLANIAEGLGGSSGGTGSTTTPGPSTGSQIAGTALLGTGILGQTGAFGSNGWLSGLGSSAGYSGASGISPAVDSALASAAYAARGGAIPHRASGGPLGTYGLGGSPISAVPIPTGTPDVSASIVPGSSGMGAAPSGKGHFNLNTSTGSTTTTDGGDSTIGSILKAAGGIAAGIYGGPAGALAANALGSQVHFSEGGGITPLLRPHVPHFGGITSGIHVPHFATGGAPPIKGGNGVMIPQLGGGPSGGGLSSAPSSVSDYLANTAASAYHPPAPVAAPAAAPSGGGLGGLSLTQPEQNYLQQFLSSETSDAGPGTAGWGAFGAGNNQGSQRRGGAIQRRDSGGGITDDPLPPSIRDHLLNDAYVPPDDSGYYGPPEGRTPTGPAPSPQLETALTDATPQPFHPSSAPPPPQEQAQQQGQQSQSSGSSGHSPWEALLNVGLGILSGTSPHAGVNIGRGALQGLQITQQQRVQDEQQALARLAQQETSQYRQGELAHQDKALAQQGELTRAQQAQTAAHQAALEAHERDQLAQQLKLGMAHLGVEGARLNEDRRFHDIEATPADVRAFNFYNSQPPEVRAQYDRYEQSRKGKSSIFLDSGSSAPAPVGEVPARPPLSSLFGVE